MKKKLAMFAMGGFMFFLIGALAMAGEVPSGKPGEPPEIEEGQCNEADLEAAYQQGYIAGMIAGSDGECAEVPACEPAILSPTLVLNVPKIEYQTLFGNLSIWATFEFLGIEEEKVLFELVDFGALE